MTTAAALDTLPDGRIVSWYGDDLTGSAAVMEVLTLAGLPAVLFMGVPTQDELDRYESFPCIGVAGTARHRDPMWMKDHLPTVFEFLATLNAPICHYKVCSTFDSDPSIGSIGTAIELALPILGGEWTPLLVAAPPIGRYQAFGNLFAVADGTIYRLDRHPTMSAHPVTPMEESDIARHLARQTTETIGLIDLVSIGSGRASHELELQIEQNTRLISLDATDNSMLLEVGRLIWNHKGDRLLAVGSQGVEYALVSYWSEMGVIDSRIPTETLQRANRFAAVSASVSPVTASQLTWADDNGFDLLRVDVSQAVDVSRWQVEIDRASKIAEGIVANGGSPIVYTALGPNDPSIRRFKQEVEASGHSVFDVRERIGDGLGSILGHLVNSAGVTRVAVVGGDTSGQVTRALGIRSLTLLSPMGHATSMMRAHTGADDRLGLEYTLKGGQMGSKDFFGTVKDLHSTT